MLIESSALNGTTNSRGNVIETNEDADAILGFVRGGALAYKRILTERGWQVYNTPRDAWDFGVFVNVETRVVMTYADCDRLLVLCASEDTFQAELESMSEFYGAPALDFTAANPHAETDDSLDLEYDLAFM